MIERLEGRVAIIKEKYIVVDVHGVGFAVTVARPEQFAVGKTQVLPTYCAWSQDRGPVLFGFSSELERTFFLLVISCPKIGPALAMQLLSQADVELCLQIIHRGDVSELSSFKGLGAKKAAQIINDLQDKVLELMGQSTESSILNDRSKIVRQVGDALGSLGYTKPEIVQALSFIASSENTDQLEFDKLLRQGLSFLSRGGKSL